MKTQNFIAGEKVKIKTDAVDQKSQIKLNGKEGIVTYAGHTEILVNVSLRGKSRNLPFSKSELQKI